MSETEVGFEEFVRSRQAALVRLGWALTGDRGLGEDLAQASFDRLWRRWEQVRAAGDAWPYVQRIAVSLALSWRRRRWRGEVPTETVIAVSQSPDETDNWVSRHLVASWLADLPARQRAVVVLRFLMDLSVDDTANRLGCSPGTVKSQTAKALQTLRPRNPSSMISEEGEP